MRQHRPILYIGAVVLLAVAIGYVMVAYFAIHPLSKSEMKIGYWALSFMFVTVAIVSFFGLMWYMQTLGGEWALDKAGMRLAIVGSIITVYLVLVGVYGFSTSVQKVPPLTDTLLTNFTAVVVAIVTFYFGSSAYVQTRQKDGKPAGEDTKKKT